MNDHHDHHHEAQGHHDHELGFQAFLKGIILFGFTMLFFSLIISGHISYYIAPKMMPFAYFSLVTFFLLSILQILRSTAKGREEENACGCDFPHEVTGSLWKKVGIYSIFIFPLLTGFTLPEKILDSSVASVRGVQLGTGIYSKPEIKRAESSRIGITKDTETEFERVDQFLADLEVENEDIDHFSIEDTYFLDGFDDYYGQIVADFLDKDTVIVTDENFLDMMTAMDLYLDHFLGKQVEITGFVYREEGIKEDEMVVARFALTCCTADAAVYGLLTKGEHTRGHDVDTWVTIKGIIDQADYNKFTIPIVLLESIERVETPDSPYVYPNFF